MQINWYKFISNPLSILLFALVLGFVLRITLLTQIPPGFNWDEASVAYNAYSLAETRKDEFGKSWPLFIESFGDYKTGLYSILLAPIIKVFGLSVFIARFPNVLIGVLVIFTSYFFALQYFGKRTPAALVALLIAISPWAIHVSRFVLEWHLGLPLLMLGGGFFLKAQTKPKFLVTAAAFFALSLYFYHSLRLFVPLLLFITIIVKYKWFLLHKKETIKAFFVGVLILIPFAIAAVTNNIFARPSAVSIFSINSDSEAKEGQYRQTIERMPVFMFMNNKIVFYSRAFISRYLNHFSPQFLFTGELRASPRTAIKDVGLLYIISLPFLLLGLYQAIRNPNEKSKFLILWMFLAPIAASLTQDAPHELRSLIFLPTFQIFTIVGLVFAWNKLEKFDVWKKTVVALFILLAYSGQLLFFLNRYYLFYPEETAIFWQSGHDELAERIQLLEPSFDTVIVTTGYGQPHIFFAFFNKMNPKEYQLEIANQQTQFNGRVEHLGKITFREPTPEDLCLAKTLVVTTHKGFDQSIKPYEIISAPNRFHKPEPIFILYDTTTPNIMKLCTSSQL